MTDIAAVGFLLEVAEQAEPQIAGPALRRNLGAAADDLVGAGVLVRTAPEVPQADPRWHDGDDLAFEFGWDAPLIDGPVSSVSVEALEADPFVYRLDFEWLLAAIARELGVPASARSTCLVAELLWDLGDAWLGQRKASVLFARRLSDAETLDAVCDALTRRVGRPPGVLLTTTRRIPRHVVIPGHHRVLGLAECLRGDAPGFALDTDVLSGAVSGLHPQRPAQLIDPSPDFRIVRALGRTFHFKGEKQRRVLEYLYLQWRDGNDRVSVAELVAELELPAKTRVRDLFKKHPAWGVLLTEERGSCRFLV